ncbi:uncharacterized protein JCM6883_005818 [Sporobolomyces salmoneus]|uniref:uncharacterized protein n=1 Tax=Sporobolomyces salmoneus TaxID=183962 RepID=UPI0031742112
MTSPTSTSPHRISTTLKSRRVQALVLLTIQNASVSLLTRYSLQHAIYSPNVAVLSTELVKASISLIMYLLESHNISTSRKGKESETGSTIRHVVEELFNKEGRRAIVQMTIPAVLYSIQNTLLYTALSNLTPQVYQTTYQLKLVTTAIFSILFFRIRISRRKWISLFLLTAGVIIVQLNSSTTTPTRRMKVREGEDVKKGFLAIFAACVSSGFAGVWFERILKSSSRKGRPRPTNRREIEKEAEDKRKPQSSSLWKRNLQLSIPSILFTSIGVYLSHGGSWWDRGGVGSLWNGFTPLVWFVVSLQSMGGLLVALVVKEASSIDKGFATSIAIILSTLLSSAFDLGDGGGLNWNFGLGAGLVVCSTVLYSI